MKISKANAVAKGGNKMAPWKYPRKSGFFSGSHGL